MFTGREHVKTVKVSARLVQSPFSLQRRSLLRPSNSGEFERFKQFEQLKEAVLCRQQLVPARVSRLTIASLCSKVDSN